MNRRVAVGACLAVALVAASAWSAGLQSGPQPGDHLVPFEPTNVTGPFAGKQACLI